jgi:hypothetical protein
VGSVSPQLKVINIRLQLPLSLLRISNLHTTLNTQHSALNTQHSTLNTQHSPAQLRSLPLIMQIKLLLITAMCAAFSHAREPHTRQLVDDKMPIKPELAPGNWEEIDYVKNRHYRRD